MIEMKILSSREEWLEHRKNYIGGSDAACIVGMNPWKSNLELWLEKTGEITAPDISDNQNVKFGVDAEPIIRELFKINYPNYVVFYEENNSWTNDRFPFAAVSHDGWITDLSTGRKGVWECKTTEIVSSMAKEKWKNQVPDNYYCQILHSLMVREDCEFAHLTALLTWKFNEEQVFQEIRNYHFERADLQDDIDYLASQERKFWKSTKEGKKPGLILPRI